MEVTKFTKTISQILSQSHNFIRFVNTFFDCFQNNTYFAILCNILKEILLKICDENASFLNNITDFLSEIPMYTYVSAIMELLVTLVNYHPDHYQFTEETNEYLLRSFAENGSLFDYIQMAERIVSNASSPRRSQPQTLAVFKPESLVRIVCESESPIIKVNALNVLGKLGLSEEKKREVAPVLLNSLTNTAGIVRAKIIEFTGIVPSNYVSIVANPRTHCNIKQQIVSNAHTIKTVAKEDITALAEKMNAPENKANPFITNLLEILLQRSEFQGQEWSEIRKQVAKRKNKRVSEYGGSSKRENHRSSLMPMPIKRTSQISSSAPKESQIKGLRAFNSNTWVCV